MDTPQLRSTPRWLLLVSALSAAALAACGGSDGPVPAPAPEPSPPLGAAEACEALAAATVEASLIGLPTTGARVTGASLKAAAGTGAQAVGEYCEVLGSIASVDPAAPPISFQLNLPTEWNDKAFQQTGGGYDGNVVSGTGNVPGAVGFATPLARGYATFGSDSGHDGPATDASFGINDEALENYFGDQLRKTRDVAVELIRRRYGQAPSRTYIAGGSGGGREALYAADRWPELYDGVISYYPAWSLTAMILNYGRISQALNAPGAWPNAAKQALVAPAVIAACDGLDGAVDGVVSNAAACSFDPQVLRCPGGADTGDSCLSDAELAGIGSFAQGLSLPYALANGVTAYPAFNVFNAATDLRGGALGAAAPANPVTTLMPFSSYIFEPMWRYWVMRDANADSFRFDLEAPSFIRQRLGYISSRLDVRPDLSAFSARGGKLILVTGQADSIIPSATSVDLYNALNASMGTAAAADFMRFYYVPGYDHGSGHQFNLAWDSVSALETWVEGGTAPAEPVARDANAAASGRTRPLCAYPTWPKYSGSGDVNLAASFTCSP